MKIAAIICEYNPLHSGHKYHIEATKKISGCDYVLAVMSGETVQRGEFAIAGKHTRAESAIRAGADIVVQLPTVFSSSNAQVFAAGAIKLIAGFGDVQWLSFGSESGDINKLSELADIMASEPEPVSRAIKETVNAGQNYVRAQYNAYIKHCGSLADLLKSPNNILALEYIKALKSQNSSITPIAVKRLGNGYNSETLNKSGFSSSTAIRNAFFSNDISALESMPEETRGLYSELKLPDSQIYFALLKNKIMSVPIDGLKKIFDMSEGLEHKFSAAAASSSGLSGFFDKIKTKRYTLARLKRLCLSILLDITCGTVETAFMSEPYYNILAANAQSQKLLKLLPHSSILSYSSLSKLNLAQERIIQIDKAAHRLYSIVTQTPCKGFIPKLNKIEV